ncbi:MAG: prepilin peptidase [Nitrospirae bacterium]|nr:MAG: prepilin peptidase [Nitrospirota bacterium]
MALTSALLLGCLGVGLVIAAATDVRSGRIPNAITFPLASIGVAVHGITRGWDGVLFSLEGLAVGLGALLLFYALGGMGAGDVKLLGAVGAVIGPVDVFVAFLATACFGGLYAISLMMMTWGLPRTAERVRVMMTTWLVTKRFSVGSSSSHQPNLRYGLAIGLGTLASQAWRLTAGG